MKFSEIKQKYLNFRKEFKEIVNDKFGSSVDNEQLANIENNINFLVLQEEKIELENLKINKILFEARSIIPIYKA